MGDVSSGSSPQKVESVFVFQQTEGFSSLSLVFSLVTESIGQISTIFSHDNEPAGLKREIIPITPNKHPANHSHTDHTHSTHHFHRAKESSSFVSPANGQEKSSAPIVPDKPDLSKSNESAESGDPKPDQTGDEKPIKEVAEIAKQIAKELFTPERFNFFILTNPLASFRMPSPVFKEEKPSSEDLAQKAPSSKSQAVAKGEAKTIQQPDVPEEIDPVEKAFKSNFFQAALKNPLPIREGHETAPQLFEKFATLENFVPPSAFISFPQTKEEGVKGERVEWNNISNPSPTPSAKLAPSQLPSPSQSISEQKNVQQPQKIPEQIEKNPTLPAERVETNKMPPSSSTPSLPPQPSDPAKIIKGHHPMGKVPEVLDHKHGHHRKDLIPGVDRSDQAAVLHRQRPDDDNVVVPLSIFSNQSMHREGILKDKGGKKGVQLKEDDGFKLGDIVLMLLSGVICNAKNTAEIFAYLEARESFFTTWLGLKKGLPSHRLLALVMKRLKPNHLEPLIHLALGKIDSPLKHVGVWETDRGLLLAELNGDKQDKRKKPLLDTLELFDLDEAIATVDCERLNSEISKQMRTSGGHYLVALKGKQGIPYEKAQEFFSIAMSDKTDIYRDVVQEKNLTMLREIFIAEEISWFPEKGEWMGLRTAVKFLSETRADNRTTMETRLYISSLPLDAKEVAETLRTHPTIESKVDWFMDLDFTFGAVDHRQANFDYLRAYSWDLLNLETTQNINSEAKRKKAKVDNTYLRIVLGTHLAA